jgi:hypothetical protein
VSYARAASGARSPPPNSQCRAEPLVPGELARVPPGYLLGFFTHNVLSRSNGAMVFDPFRGVSLWARRKDFVSLPLGAASNPELLQFAPVYFQVVRRNNQDWASNVTFLNGSVPSLTLAGVLSQSQGEYYVTPCSESKRAVHKRVRVPVSGSNFTLRPGFCRFTTQVCTGGQVSAQVIAPLESIDPSCHAPEVHISWFRQAHSTHEVAVDTRHPLFSEIKGTALPSAEQAPEFLRLHQKDILIVPEARQAREWLEAVACAGSQAAVVIPLHEHTIPEYPDTPNEIIGSLPPDLRQRLALQIRYCPSPALVSNPAVSVATPSQQFFRWALARFGEPSSTWAGQTLECPLGGIAMAVPRGAPNVDSAAAFAFRQIEHARVEQVCGFSSPRHNFFEVFGLDRQTTEVVNSFPEARRDFLVEELPWLYQSNEGWSFFFQRALSFGDFASPSIFGRSFPISNTHLRSRGIPGLTPEEVLSLVQARNRGPTNPVVAFLDHSTKRLYTTKTATPSVFVKQSGAVAVVCGFSKHLPLPERASVLKHVIPSVNATDCWLGNHPTRPDLRSGVFFTPPETWHASHSQVAEVRQALFNLGLTLLHPAPRSAALPQTHKALNPQR